MAAQDLDLIARWPANAVGGATMAALDASGRVYLTGLSTGWTNVAVHDMSTGRFLGTVGRRGEGPGEFLRIAGIATRGDSVAVLDSRNQRISIFGPDFNLVGSVRVSVRATGRSLGWIDAGFLVSGVWPGRVRGQPVSLWLIPRDGPEAEIPGVAVDSVALGSFSHVRQGDSLLVSREYGLGVWALSATGGARKVIDRPDFTPQNRADLPGFLPTGLGAWATWMDGDRLITLFPRFTREQEFPRTKTDPPRAEFKWSHFVTLLRIQDLANGRIVMEAELPQRVYGALAPGLVWAADLHGIDPSIEFWRIRFP